MDMVVIGGFFALTIFHYFNLIFIMKRSLFLLKFYQ